MTQVAEPGAVAPEDLEMDLSRMELEADQGNSAEAIRSAAAAAENKPIKEFTLSNGIVLSIKAVPPQALRAAASKEKAPKPPTVYIEDKGREEPNPNDPDYLDSLLVYQANQVYRVVNVMMLLGTKILHLPEDILHPDSDEWYEPLQALDIDVPLENKSVRYLSWLRLYAIETAYDMRDIMQLLTVKSGVTEIEVQKAVDAFRSQQKRGADSDVPAEEGA